MAEQMLMKYLPRGCYCTTTAGFGAIASADAKLVMSASIKDLQMLACTIIPESVLPI